MQSLHDSEKSSTLNSHDLMLNNSDMITHTVDHLIRSTLWSAHTQRSKMFYADVTFLKILKTIFNYLQDMIYFESLASSLLWGLQFILLVRLGFPLILQSSCKPLWGLGGGGRGYMNRNKHPDPWPNWPAILVPIPRATALPVSKLQSKKTSMLSL